MRRQTTLKRELCTKLNDLAILQQISTNCDNLPSELRKAKEKKHYTNQQIADKTGLSISTVNKMLAGELKNPGIFSVAPVCACLGLSMDTLMGATQNTAEESREDLEHMRLELAHKDELLAEKAQAINRLLDRSRMQEEGIHSRDEQIHQKDQLIAQKDAEIKAVRKADKPLIYGLCGLSILLTLVWGVYVVLDFQRPDAGLIKAGEVSPWIWLGGALVITLLVMLLHITVSRWYRKRR